MCSPTSWCMSWVPEDAIVAHSGCLEDPCGALSRMGYFLSQRPPALHEAACELSVGLHKTSSVVLGMHVPSHLL